MSSIVRTDIVNILVIRISSNAQVAEEQVVQSILTVCFVLSVSIKKKKGNGRKVTEQELLAVLDMSEEGQIMWCLVHTDMREPESLVDLAFRLSGGKIVGKKPIEYIIDALIKKLDDDSE